MHLHLVELVSAAAFATIGCGQSTSPRCELSETYVWTVSGSSLGFDGSTVTYQSTMTFTPPAAFEFLSSITGGESKSCGAHLPACGEMPAIDVSDIEAAIGHADVQAAFDAATAPDYPQFQTDGGGGSSLSHAGKQGFSITTGTCGFGPPSPPCREPPAGIAALVDLLGRLEAQQRAAPTCQ